MSSRMSVQYAEQPQRSRARTVGSVIIGILTFCGCLAAALLVLAQLHVI
jgi:hypothetical protein